MIILWLPNRSMNFNISFLYPLQYNTPLSTIKFQTTFFFFKKLLFHTVRTYVYVVRKKFILSADDSVAIVIAVMMITWHGQLKYFLFYFLFVHFICLDSGVMVFFCFLKRFRLNGLITQQQINILFVNFRQDFN